MLEVARASRQLGALVWTRTRETVTPLGFKLAVGLHPAYERMRNGTFEPDEPALIASFLQRVDRFVDVGANLVYYTASRCRMNVVSSTSPRF